MNRFVDINVSEEMKGRLRDHLEFVKIKFYYTQDELDAKGLKESDLKILWHNETSRKWEQIPQQGYDSTDIGTKTEWIQLETIEKTKDDTYTYFDAKTNAFSPFAIAGIKGSGAVISDICSCGHNHHCLIGMVCQTKTITLGGCESPGCSYLNIL